MSTPGSAMPDPDAHTRSIAADALRNDDPTGWFDRLYLQAEEGAAEVPWDRGVPQQLLLDWVDRHAVDGAGRSALVIGCGPGRDAEYVAGLGFDTVAFDVSATAVAIARRRHPESTVQYYTADLLDPPPAWLGGFDFVMESLTVQSLPEPPRHEAIRQIPGFLRPGGTLLVIANARANGEAVEGPPWPLTPSEVDSFARADITQVSREQIPDESAPAIRRWRVELRRTPGDSTSGA